MTCELHDGYFCLMTIKHAISKIEWAIELLYNSVKTGSQWVGDQMSLETSWWEDAGMRTCPREAGPPGPQLSSPGEWERHTAMSGGVGEVKCCSSVRSLTPSHSKTLSNLFATFQIKWEVYFFKEVFARLYYCVNMYSACICVMCLYS